MSSDALVVGIDVGTSGVRCVAMDSSGSVRAQSSVKMSDHRADERAPATWWRVTETSLDGLLAGIDAKSVRAIAVDGTSGTVLPVDATGAPLANALMYSDPVMNDRILASISSNAPASSAARGATSGLAKALFFSNLEGFSRALHQADWIAGKLSGCFDLSDANNCLKTGYDPVTQQWPDWISATGMDLNRLPNVVPPGSLFGKISVDVAKRFGLSSESIVVAGTTDGCASFLATGASDIGDGVSALGSSLTLKVLSDKPISAPQFGIYSHRIGDKWLAGGASNTGGKVLAKHFSVRQIIELSKRINPETDTGLNYYPLVSQGERFPIADPAMNPKMLPRPSDDAEYLKAIFEGIAMIEALGYRHLVELGCAPLRSVRRRLRDIGVGAGGADVPGAVGGDTVAALGPGQEGAT